MELSKEEEHDSKALSAYMNVGCLIEFDKVCNINAEKRGIDP